MINMFIVQCNNIILFINKNKMYETKIFDSLEAMWKFLCKYKITDYSFKDYVFNFRWMIKTNYFLSFKINK
jgi:hypothetical protein